MGRHRIQGISDEFVPSIVKIGELGRILDIWDGDAIVMSQRIANELGIAVGISSGANLLGALEIAHEQGVGACVRVPLRYRARMIPSVRFRTHPHSHTSTSFAVKSVSTALDEAYSVTVTGPVTSIGSLSGSLV